MYALLYEHPLDRKLYGAAVPLSAEGIKRLMIMGLVVKHVQLATKSKNVDSVLPASFLKSHFPRRRCSVLHIASAMQTVKSIIDSKNILILAPPER
jgi:hypothetical protein